MYKKLEYFVASLTDDEIDAQLKDIFDWARVYKELLEAEKMTRYKTNKYLQDDFETLDGLRIETENLQEEISNDEAVIEFEDPDVVTKEMSIDFGLAQRIQQEVSMLSIDVTKEQLIKLKKLSSNLFSPQELAQLRFEIYAREAHLFELAGESADDVEICLSCGAELKANARFCHKCGTAVTAEN